jgi:hypothetical protein
MLSCTCHDFKTEYVSDTLLDHEGFFCYLAPPAMMEPSLQPLLDWSQ